jgi:DNA-binding response OmpR family regulator
MKRKSILLAGDEKLALNSLSRGMASEEFEVPLVANGEEAVIMINSGHFDIVVTDLMMPGLDGFQVLKVAKKRNARTIVIFLIGYDDMGFAVDALQLGADDFLLKPCDPKELLSRISACLMKQEMQRNISSPRYFTWVSVNSRLELRAT